MPHAEEKAFPELEEFEVGEGTGGREVCSEGVECLIASWTVCLGMLANRCLNTLILSRASMTSPNEKNIASRAFRNSSCEDKREYNMFDLIPG